MPSTHLSYMGVTSHASRTVLLGDIIYESTNYRWRGTTGTYLTAIVKSTNAMHRTKFERRARIEEWCRNMSIDGEDEENVDNEYRY